MLRKKNGKKIWEFALVMHLALSTIHLTLLSCSIIALFDAISVISFSPILATRFGSNSQNASLLSQNFINTNKNISTGII